MNNEKIRVTVVKIGENIQGIKVGERLRFKKDEKYPFYHKIDVMDASGRNVGKIVPTKKYILPDTTSGEDIYESVKDKFTGVVVDNTKTWNSPHGDLTCLIVELDEISEIVTDETNEDTEGVKVEDAVMEKETTPEEETTVVEENSVTAKDNYTITVIQDEDMDIEVGSRIILTKSPNLINANRVLASINGKDIGCIATKGKYLIPSTLSVDDIYDEVPKRFTGVILNNSFKADIGNEKMATLLFVKVDEKPVFETIKVAVMTTKDCLPKHSRAEDVLRFEKCSKFINCLRGSCCIGRIYPDFTMDGVSCYDEIVNKTEEKFEGTVAEFKYYDEIVAIIAEVPIL